jgi:hypothetical protein
LSSKQKKSSKTEEVAIGVQNRKKQKEFKNRIAAIGI